MYQVNKERREKAKNLLGWLANSEHQLSKTLEKYNKGTITEISKSNDEIGLRSAHDYFTKMLITLDDHLYTMEWEEKIRQKVSTTRVKYRLAIMEKYPQMERQKVVEELLRREEITKETHRAYLCDVRET